MAEEEKLGFTFPHKYVKNTSTGGTIPTANWQKDSYTTKSVRKIHM